MWGNEVIFWSQKKSASKKVWESLSQSMPFTSSVNRIRTVWWRSSRRDQMIMVLVLLQGTKVWNVTWTYSYTFASKCMHIRACKLSSFIKILDHGKIVTYISQAGKAIPLQSWSGPEGSRKLRFPDFVTTAQGGGKVVSLTHRPPLPPRNTPGTHFC
jgi:hypothetical protein